MCCKTNSPSRTLQQIFGRKLASYQRESAQGVRVPRAELSYEDLHNVPMLLIVTEKARMGDTFPHSLVSLDLRLRTAGTLTAFMQELGRMCRYPATRLLHDATKPLSVSGVLAALGAADAAARSAAETEMPGAIEEDIDAAVRAAADARRLLELELPMVVVLAGGTDQDIRAHVHSLPELRAELRKLLDPQLRNWDDPLDGGVVTHFDLHCYFDRLPHAIVRADVQKLLVDGIRVKESRAPNSSSTSTLQCVLMKDGLDMYMKPTDRRKDTNKKLLEGITDHVNPLHDYTKYEPTRADDADDGKKTPHYDATPSRQQHPNRLLLFAECQIGKTGAYLYYLTRLAEEVHGSNDPFIVPEPIDGRWSWFFPYWENIGKQQQPRLKCAHDTAFYSRRLSPTLVRPIHRYSEPKQGHYYQKVAEGRMSKLQELVASPTWATDYCDWLLSPEGEVIVSTTGRELVKALRDRLLPAEGAPVLMPIDGATRALMSGSEAEKTLRDCVDWDGRMAGLRELHENIGAPA